MVSETLNRLKWTGRLGGCSITIRHRGAPGDKRAIAGEKITELKKTYFVYENMGKETTIPMHRVLQISVDGELVWKRKISEG